MSKRKDDTIPLWARKNVQARVMPRKPDVIPLWARGQSAVIAKQTPQDPAARAMHNSVQKGLAQRGVAPSEEPETVKEPLPRAPIVAPFPPHPLAHRSREDAEKARQHQYQNYALQAHAKREAAKQLRLEAEAVAHAARANAEAAAADKVEG